MRTKADLLAAQLYVDLAKRRGFAWDGGIARYRDLESGRLVGEQTIRNMGQAWLDRSVERNIRDITQRMIDGKKTLGDWQRDMARELKDAAIVEASLGRGGRNQMEQSDWGRVGARLREQYRYLNQFAQDIKAGLLSDAEILRRAQMYAQAARTNYFDGLTSGKTAAGFGEEMRVLTPAEHCSGCIQYAGYWAPIGSLPPLGSQNCLSNCRCYKRYRKTMVDEQGNVSYIEA